MRLDASRHPEEVAADLIEGWSAVETALRSLVGGSALTGQMLVRELRTRHVITLEQANALVEFQAARDRAQRTDYRPTEGDVDAARQGFLKLEAGLMAASLSAASPTPSSLEAHPLGPPDANGNPILPPAGMPGAQPLMRSGRRPAWLVPLLGLVLVAALGVIGWWAYDRRGGGALAEGVELYRAGQRERAQAAFERAAREEPQDARPHIFMARMAREVGNLPLAQQEAQRAIQLDQTSGDAMREMGSILFTRGDLVTAARFYARAVERDTSDRAAMGWLGCVLMRQGRPADAQRWFQRAGQGDWSTCARIMPPQGAPGTYPPGAYPPQSYPPGTVPPGMQPPPQQPYPQQVPQQPPPQGTYIPRSP